MRNRNIYYVTFCVAGLCKEQLLLIAYRINPSAADFIFNLEIRKAIKIEASVISQMCCCP